MTSLSSRESSSWITAPTTVERSTGAYSRSFRRRRRESGRSACWGSRCPTSGEATRLLLPENRCNSPCSERLRVAGAGASPAGRGMPPRFPGKRRKSSIAQSTGSGRSSGRRGYVLRLLPPETVALRAGTPVLVVLLHVAVAIEAEVASGDGPCVRLVAIDARRLGVPSLTVQAGEGVMALLAIGNGPQLLPLAGRV